MYNGGVGTTSRLIMQPSHGLKFWCQNVWLCRGATVPLHLMQYVPVHLCLENRLPGCMVSGSATLNRSHFPLSSVPENNSYCQNGITYRSPFYGLLQDEPKMNVLKLLNFEGRPLKLKSSLLLHYYYCMTPIFTVIFRFSAVYYHRLQQLITPCAQSTLYQYTM